MTKIRIAAALVALGVLLAPSGLRADDEAAGTRASAIAAVARTKTRVAKLGETGTSLKGAVTDAKKALEELRNAPARGRSEKARRENARMVAAAEWALLLAQARHRAGAPDTNHLEEEIAVMSALLEGEEYAAAEEHATRTARALLSLQAARTKSLAALDEMFALDDQGRTQLHKAAMESDAEAAGRALAVGLPVDRADKDGFSPLHLAAWVGAEGVTKQLLDAGADVALSAPQSPLAGDPLGVSKAADCPLSGPNALHLACYAGRGNVVELLLERDADPSAVLGFKDAGAG